MSKMSLTALSVVLAVSACSSPPTSDNASSGGSLPITNTTVTTKTSTVVMQLEQASDVPKGWATQWSAAGDLNGDGVPDQVLVLKRAGTTGDGPRRLLIASKNPDGSRSVTADTETFLPNVENEIDPLAEDNPLTIKNRTLRIYVEGTGTDRTHEVYTFRYQNAKFRLIGYDSVNRERGTGDYDNMSINYLTGNMDRSVGNIARFKDVVTKTRLPAGERPTLSSINLTEGFSPPAEDS